MGLLSFPVNDRIASDLSADSILASRPLSACSPGGFRLACRRPVRKLRQVLLNLLSNALKFTPEAGRIDVRAAMHEGLVELSVADTGVGIAPEDQAVIFEEFRQVGTTARKVEGTGLGLALSRRFIELHGGRIWVSSRMGEGSTFTFALPVGGPR
jgi:signal transduction histidine kinase